MTTMSGGSILLHERYDDLRRLLTDLLADDGHEVQACASTQEVLERGAVRPGALALVDYRSASHSSLSATERRAVSALARAVPTVLIAAQAWAGEQVAQELGLLAVVRKPCDVERISEIVRCCVGRLRASNEMGDRREPSR